MFLGHGDGGHDISGEAEPLVSENKIHGTFPVFSNPPHDNEFVGCRGGRLTVVGLGGPMETHRADDDRDGRRGAGGGGLEVEMKSISSTPYSWTHEISIPDQCRADRQVLFHQQTYSEERESHRFEQPQAQPINGARRVLRQRASQSSGRPQKLIENGGRMNANSGGPRIFLFQPENFLGERVSFPRGSLRLVGKWIPKE